MLKPLPINFKNYITLSGASIQTYIDADGNNTTFFNITARQLFNALFDAFFKYGPLDAIERYDMLDGYIARKCRVDYGVPKLVRITGNMCISHDTNDVRISALDAMMLIGEQLDVYVNSSDERIVYSDTPVPALEYQRLLDGRWDTVDIVSTKAEDIEAYRAFHYLFANIPLDEEKAPAKAEKYALIYVYERDISTTLFYSLEDAQAKMLAQIKETGIVDDPKIGDNYDDYEVSEDTAWVNHHGAHDWKIEQV